jgi:PAS domain S-box-containing protein
MMRILVVDDHELVRRGICSVLAAEPSIILCGEAVDGQDAIEKTKTLHPDIVVMDVSMPRLNGLDATREIKRLLPDVEIVIVSQHEAPEMVRQAFNAGARGYVVKSAISADLLAAIAKAQHREPFLRSAQSGSESRNLDSQEILRRSAAYEQALRESEERFRSAMNNLAEGLHILDTEGRVTYVNPSAEKMFGWTCTELLGKKMHEVIHFKRLDGTPFPFIDCHLLGILTSGTEIHEQEDTFIRKDGSFFPVVFSASPMRIDGEAKGIVVSFRDDTKRRQTEEALQQSERIYRAIGESIDFGVWICNPDGRNIYASPSFLELIGTTQEQYSEFGWARVLHPDHAQASLDAWQECVRNGKFWERELRFSRPGGGSHHVLSRGVPIRDEDGKILYWAGTNLDIHHRKEAEIALEARVAERTEELLKTRNELQELSARLFKTQDEERRRIARELHDGVGQLLAAMNMNLAILFSEQAGLSRDAAKSLAENGSLVDQALRDIRTMSYLLHPPLLDEIGLGSALEWYLGGFAQRSSITVSLDVTPDLGKLPRDVELSLFRIVQECLTNIHRHSGSQTARVRLYRALGEVILEVSDDGKGIPPDLRHKVSSGESFGLGIRGIRERLRQFGGRLEVQSGDTGTVVLAALPNGPKEADEENPEGSSRKYEADAERNRDRSLVSATILCIDDKPTAMFARKRLLESAGHRVIEARSGPEGIGLFKSQSVDAVILDHWMSGMKGAVAAELKALDPSVPIIVLSGSHDFAVEKTGVIDEWLLNGNTRPEYLLVTIKALLERRPVRIATRERR